MLMYIDKPPIYTAIPQDVFVQKLVNINKKVANNTSPLNFQRTGNLWTCDSKNTYRLGTNL